MIRIAALLSILTLVACGADGDPIRPGSPEDIANQQAGM